MRVLSHAFWLTLALGCGRPAVPPGEAPVAAGDSPGAVAVQAEGAGQHGDPAQGTTGGHDDIGQGALSEGRSAEQPGATAAGPAAGRGGSRPAPGEWVDLEEFQGEAVRVEREEKDGRPYRLRCVKVSDGTDHGPEWRFHPNGVLMSIKTWVHGVVEGPQTGWFDTGFVRLEGACVAGERHGVWRRYFDDVDDGIAWERGYVDGQPDGKWTRWYRGGKVKGELSYENGEQTGKEQAWSLDGTLLLDAEWLAGARHGPYRELEEGTGLPKLEGFYEQGQRIGLWVEHQNGVKRSEGEYAEGLREGHWTFWGEDGSVDEDLTGDYSAGELLSAAQAGSPGGGE